MRRFAVVLSLFATLALAPTLAHAQTEAELIEHGIALREDGRDEEALAVFTRAYEAGHSAQALAQMALAEQALGRHVQAEAHLTTALADRDDRFIRRNRAALAQALTEISAEIGTLAIDGGVPGAEVDAGDGVRATMPLDAPLRLGAGHHHVIIRADGHRTFEADIDITGGGAASITATLVADAPIAPAPEPTPEPVASPEPPPPPASSSGWVLPVGIAGASVGVVAIASASGLMAVREDNARARLTCSDTDPACRARYQAALDAESAGIGLYVVGGALLVAGGALVLVDVLGHGGASDARALRCAPGLLSIGCAGSF